MWVTVLAPISLLKRKFSFFPIILSYEKISHLEISCCCKLIYLTPKYFLISKLFLKKYIYIFFLRSFKYRFKGIFGIEKQCFLCLALAKAPL